MVTCFINSLCKLTRMLHETQKSFSLCQAIFLFPLRFLPFFSHSTLGAMLVLNMPLEYYKSDQIKYFRALACNFSEGNLFHRLFICGKILQIFF